MADEFTYNSSIQEQETTFEFSNRQFAYIPDQNSGNYVNGQVTFDLASLSNSGKFVSWENSYLTIPLIMHAKVTGGEALTNSQANAFALSLKNGYHQLINSLSCEITNNQVVQLTNYSNLNINYKLLTTCSVDD